MLATVLSSPEDSLLVYCHLVVLVLAAGQHTDRVPESHRPSWEGDVGAVYIHGTHHILVCPVTSHVLYDGGLGPVLQQSDARQHRHLYRLVPQNELERRLGVVVNGVLVSLQSKSDNILARVCQVITLTSRKG